MGTPRQAGFGERHTWRTRQAQLRMQHSIRNHMKIDSMCLYHVRMPLVAPFETSFGREVDRECILIALQSGDLTGYGECVASYNPGYNYETTGTAGHILKDFIAPLILGQDLSDAADFQACVSSIRGHHLAK